MITEKSDTIYFSEDWAMPKYHGWRLLVKEENAVVLIKHMSFISKMLVLTYGLDTHAVNRIMDNIPYNKFMTRINWHDFTDTSSAHSLTSAEENAQTQIRLGERWYEKASDGNKLIHWATFIINLDQEMDEILSRMESTVRNKFRRAQKRGAVVTIEHKAGEWTDEFFKLFRRLQDEFGLPVPDRNILENMFSGNNAIAIVGRDSEGISAINVVYLARPHAYYMLGASSNSKEQGVGQLMQLETINYLKSEGFRKYDLGGVNSAQPGILQFKKALGGDFYDLGSEWIYTPRMIDILLKLRFVVTKLRSNPVLAARFS